MDVKKRFNGQVSVFHRDKNWGFLQLENDRNGLFFHARSCRGDWRGSWAWSTVPGTPVTFTKAVKPSRKFTGHMLTSAVDLAPVFEEQPAESLDTLREVSKLIEWNGNRGLLLREDASDLFLHKSDIFTSHLIRDLKVGHFVWHGVGQRDDGRWKACSVELYSQAEQDRLQRGLSAYEVEPVAVSEPASNLLTPEKRNKTLLELIQEKRKC